MRENAETGKPSTGPDFCCCGKEVLRMNPRFQACIIESMIMPLTELGRGKDSGGTTELRC